MKKTFAILLALLLFTTFVLSGCSNNGDQPSGDASGDEIVLWFVTSGSRGDHGTADATWQGLEELASKHSNLQVNILEAGKDQSLYEAQFLEILDSGCDIFTCSANYSMADLVGQYVDDYPDTTFWFTDLNTEFVFPGTSGNCAGMLFKQNEVMFMAGVLNAKMSETGILGFVGGMESTVICDFGAGYIDGATYVNPDCKIIFSFVGDFNDSAKGKELALIQYNMGADIVHAVAGTAGLGVLEAAAEVDKWTMGVDYDQRAKFLAEGNQAIADKILSSSMKMWANAVTLFVERYINDYDSIQWGVVEQWGLKEGGVGLCKNDYYKEMVPADIQAYVDEIEQKIISGEIVPKTAMGMSTEEWAEYKDTVALN